MTRLIYDDRNGRRPWNARRRWKAWAPFTLVVILCVAALLVLALTAPVFRPLPIPRSRVSRTSYVDRVAELVVFIRDSTDRTDVESAQLERSPKDSNEQPDSEPNRRLRPHATASP